jgi:hypothetical protein
MNQNSMKQEQQSLCDSENDFRFLYSVVSISQRTRKPNAKRKLAFGFAEVQPFFETTSQTAPQSQPVFDWIAMQS